mmetsp:Transcript_19457/g.28839  ORF Transcript_19457/g.28839 Transcript_19457/m.28839 type:complete len:297 (-) Transcript_19457:1125-2015(-)
MTTCAEPRLISRHSTALDRLEAAHALLAVSPKTVIGPIPTNSTNVCQLGGGLDALATLASLEHRNSHPVSASSNSSSDEDSEAMPPPPPRQRRRRSCSNPEGMEKWDSLNGLHQRRRFVLPTSILEEELAEAKAAAERKQEEDDRAFQETQAIVEKELTPAELLKKARSRLLEDLSEGSITGQKGELILPHSLARYKNVYNKHGRIGIYTPAERAAIIGRFHSKRARRVWNKKIRYNCRKNLADRRLRVKGRFVKRSELPLPATPEEDMPDVNDPEAGFSPTADQPFRRLRRHTIT